MNAKLEEALDKVLSRWSAMAAADDDHAETAADAFEAAFYRLVDTVREWVDGLAERPRTFAELLALPALREVLERLPEPLHLNMETELELIAENHHRLPEDRYD